MLQASNRIAARSIDTANTTTNEAMDLRGSRLARRTMATAASTPVRTGIGNVTAKSKVVSRDPEPPTPLNTTARKTHG